VGERGVAVEGLGIGSVRLVMLTGSPSFTSAPVSSSCHQGERSGAVVRFSSFHLIVC